MKSDRENITSIAERIRQLIDTLGVSINNFSKDIASNSYFNKLIKSNGSIGSDKIEKILRKYPQVNMSWLVMGQGSMMKKENTTNGYPLMTEYDSYENYHVADPAENYYPDYYESIRSERITPVIAQNPSIPLIPADAVAGMSSGSVSIRENDIQEFYTIPDFEDVDFMIRVKGSSMYPKYNSGDIVACRFLEESRFIQWNKVYVLATQYQGVLVKRLKPSKNEDCFTAISDNEKYDPFDIPKSEITNIALVIGVIRLE